MEFEFDRKPFFYTFLALQVELANSMKSVAVAILVASVGCGRAATSSPTQTSVSVTDDTVIRSQGPTQASDPGQVADDTPVLVSFAPTVKPIPAPTTTPVPQPTPSPIPRPTLAPIALTEVDDADDGETCADDPDWWKSYENKKGCDWVARRPRRRCRMRGFSRTKGSEGCPEACGKCGGGRGPGLSTTQCAGIGLASAVLVGAGASLAAYKYKKVDKSAPKAMQMTSGRLSGSHLSTPQTSGEAPPVMV